MNANRLITSLTLLFALAVADRALHHLAPVQPSTVGHRDALNGRFYGWGFDPHEPIRLRDADTGEVFIAPANNHGWRDVDRNYEKPEGTFRILALGDSNTFGVLVPGEETWTRVLERRLAAEGYRAEVLNIGYSQWGTDQELEGASSRRGALPGGSRDRAVHEQGRFRSALYHQLAGGGRVPGEPVEYG